MSAALPYGGREIAELRANRQKPADMVLVSLIGPLRELNPVVIAQPARTYDWRFLTGLDVLIVASTDIEQCLVRRVADALAALKVGYLGVWFSDKQNGAHISIMGLRPKSKSMRWMSPFDRRQFAGIGR